MRDHSWVGEVVNALEMMTGINSDLQSVHSHFDTRGEQVVKDRHGVRNVNDTLVLGDLCDEVARIQVIGDRHSHTQKEHVRVLTQELLRQRLGIAVEATLEVGLVLLRESNSTSHWVGVVVLTSQIQVESPTS